MEAQAIDPAHGRCSDQRTCHFAASDREPDQCDLKDPMAPESDCCLGECGQSRGFDWTRLGPLVVRLRATYDFFTTFLHLLYVSAA
jgi:hypothetical protein